MATTERVLPANSIYDDKMRLAALSSHPAGEQPPHDQHTQRAASALVERRRRILIGLAVALAVILVVAISIITFLFFGANVADSSTTSNTMPKAISSILYTTADSATSATSLTTLRGTLSKKRTRVIAIAIVAVVLVIVAIVLSYILFLSTDTAVRVDLGAPVHEAAIDVLDASVAEGLIYTPSSIYNFWITLAGPLAMIIAVSVILSVVFVIRSHSTGPAKPVGDMLIIHKFSRDNTLPNAMAFIQQGTALEVPKNIAIKELVKGNAELLDIPNYVFFQNGRILEEKDAVDTTMPLEMVENEIIFPNMPSTVYSVRDLLDMIKDEKVFSADDDNPIKPLSCFAEFVDLCSEHRLYVIVEPKLL